jgi:hypothetical protein
MRRKDVPKEIRNLDGSLAGTLVSKGFEEFEFKGKTLKVPACYYKGEGDYAEAEGREQFNFTTSQSDTLWLCLLYDAYMRAGGKLRDLSKYAVSAYKKYKFRRKPTWFKKYYKAQQARLANGKATTNG